MVEYMKNVAKFKTSQLTIEERNLLSIAFKNVVGARRASWRVIYTLESKEKQLADMAQDRNDAEAGKQAELQSKYCQDYRVKVEKELTKICRDLLDIVVGHLIPNSSSDVSEFLPKLINAADGYKERGAKSVEEDISSQLKSLEQKSHCIAKIENGESLVFYFKMYVRLFLLVCFRFYVCSFFHFLFFLSLFSLSTPLPSRPHLPFTSLTLSIFIPSLPPGLGTTTATWPSSTSSPGSSACVPLTALWLHTLLLWRSPRHT